MTPPTIFPRLSPRLAVRDGFVLLLAALWAVDTQNMLPLFLTAAAVHEIGHLLVLYAAGGQLHRLELNLCGAVLVCRLPDAPAARAAVCLAGPAASLALTAVAGPLGCYRLAGASALLGLFNLLPMPPLDGGMALAHLASGRLPRLRCAVQKGSAAALLLSGLALLLTGHGVWLLLVGAALLVRSRKPLPSAPAAV